jgi:exodeoxyribonuclease VIII
MQVFVRHLAIMKPYEINLDLESSKYHSRPEISAHGLHLIDKAPAYYRFAQDHPKEDHDAYRFGRLVHLAVLEPEKWDSSVIVSEGFDRRTKAGKAAAELFEAQSAGKEICTPAENAIIQRITDNVYNHPSAGKLLGEIGNVEPSLFYTQKDTGVKCRARPDFILHKGIIVDLKTSQSADAGTFTRDAINYRYHVQAAMYLDAARSCELKAEAFVFIAVEKKAPYLVQVFEASDEFIDAGRHEMLQNLMAYKDCVAANNWPGYSTEVETLNLPKWYVRK